LKLILDDATSSKTLWDCLCGIFDIPKAISNNYFFSNKFFHIKMQETDRMLDHIAKMKVLAHNLAINNDMFVAALLMSLPKSYEGLVANLKSKIEISYEDLINILLLEEYN
jgi:hypothetical protein